jgi:hypothetical protein
MQITSETSSKDAKRALASFRQQMSCSQIYAAYHVVHCSMDVAEPPADNIVPATLFHAAHFVVTSLLKVKCPLHGASLMPCVPMPCESPPPIPCAL